MALFKKRSKIEDGKLVKTVPIQATVEGGRDRILLESMLTGERLNVSVPGTQNAYTHYLSQVAETYRKYNGNASFGTQQTRAIIDLRTAFISGEKISVSCKNGRTARWIEKFLTYNKLTDIGFIDASKGAELAGQVLFVLKPALWFDSSLFVKALRIPYIINTPYRAIYNDPLTREKVIDIQVRKNGQWQSAGFTNFVYVRTGGDDANTEGPSTRCGLVLTDLENYDRAIKDMRRNNHIFARITPVWETESDNDAQTLKANLEKIQWKIGNAYIGKSKFSYATPDKGAHENLLIELVATVKTISSVTGIPVHWLGYVDLMSNRSTAETLYDLIKNATIVDRLIWSSSFYEMLIKAQEMYIDNGGTEISNINYDFQIRIPLIDFAEFLNRVKGLSLAFNDEAISMDDYRNSLPGIDPLKTERAIEAEKKEKEKEMSVNILKFQQAQEEGNVIEGDENA